MTRNTYDKVIIYDDNCPLCQAYPKVFVQTGFLAKKKKRNLPKLP